MAAGFWGLMHAYLIQIAVKNYLIGGTMRDYYLRNRKALSVTKVYRKGESKRSIETPSSLSEESVRASSREVESRGTKALHFDTHFAHAVCIATCLMWARY